MKELNLHEEIIKSLKLISYDRSLSLNEQQGPNGYITTDPETYRRTQVQKKDKIDKTREEISNRLKTKEKRGCDTMLKTTPKDPDVKIAKEVFLALRKEVGEQKEFNIKSPSTWMEPSSWGTSPESILTALKKIKNRKIYYNIFEYLWRCYPDFQGKSLLQFIQENEFSRGQFGSRQYSEMTPMLAYQYEFNDYWLEKYQKILQKVNPTETYEMDYDLLSSSLLTQAKGIVLPPLTREALHVVLPLFAILSTIFTAGATSGWVASGILEIADAMVYIADGDKWMAGLSLFFAIVPVGKLMELIPSLSKLVAKGGRTALNKFIYKLAGKEGGTLTAIEKEVLEDLSMSSIREELTSTILISTVKTIVKRTTVGRGIYTFLKIVFKLIEFGFLSSQYLISFGLVMVGGFWSWGKIAIFLGVKTKEEIEQITGKDFTENKINKALPNKDLTKEMINDFNNIIKLNGSLNERWANKFDLGTLNLQLFLVKSGNNKISTSIEDITKLSADELNALYRTSTTQTLIKDEPSKNYTIGGVKQKEGNSIFIFINENPTKGTFNIGDKIEITNTTFNGVYVIKNIFYKSNKIIGVYIDSKFKPKTGVDMSFKNKGVIKYIGKLPNNLVSWEEMPELNKGIKTVNFKWGYFDNNTKESIKTYQMKNDLTPDGVAGTKTLYKIVSDLKSKKYGQILNTSGIKIFDELQNKNLQINTLDQNITPKQIETVYIDQKAQTEDSLKNSLHNIKNVPDSYVEYVVDTLITIK